MIGKQKVETKRQSHSLVQIRLKKCPLSWLRLRPYSWQETEEEEEEEEEEALRFVVFFFPRGEEGKRLFLFLVGIIIIIIVPLMRLRNLSSPPG